MYYLNYYILLSILYFTTIECKPFRFDYTSYPEMPGQFKLHNIPATWHDARLICDMEEAVLASPSSDSMKCALDAVLKDAESESEYGIFTGINSIYSKGYFYSIEGVPLGDMPLQWLPGQPDNADNNEDCIAYVNGSVADFNCSEVLPFVCYKERINTTVYCPEFESQYYMWIQHNPTTVGKEVERCFYVHSEKRTWFEANRFCLAKGGHLAIIKNMYEAKQVFSYFKLATFVGIHDWSGHGDWRTVHGQVFDESLWAKGQPHNTAGISGRTCGVVVDDRLVSRRCDDQAPFVCEYKNGKLL